MILDFGVLLLNVVPHLHSAYNIGTTGLRNWVVYQYLNRGKGQTLWGVSIHQD